MAGADNEEVAADGLDSEGALEENGDEEQDKTVPESAPEPAKPPEPVLSPEALALKKELEKIRVVAPEIDSWQHMKYDESQFPNQYRINSPTEELVLAFAENFRRQYVHLYRDRKPLLLNPLNECGTEKFVCTTVRSTQLPFIELYEWDACAEFVADYLNVEPLNPPTELPKRLRSPTTVMHQQRGHCFEYSNILCSLLIAQGYDAYVVSGYATREICLMDTTREVCSLLVKKEEEKIEERKKELKKYTVRPPKDLRSKYEIKMSRRSENEKRAEIEKKVKEEEARIAEIERPPWDPLHGLRVHSWVLVLEGKRQVPESFYIEPFTGQSHSLKTPDFHGIESIWNHKDYWVNMQDCSKGVVDLKFDLNDCTLWEYMFLNDTDKSTTTIPDPDEDFDADEDGEENAEKHLDLPQSWCEPIEITQKEFEMRCPHGKKTKYFKKAKLEKFAPYLSKDGLVARLSAYDDYELTDFTLVKEFYSHRYDHLYLKTHNLQTGWVTEHFTKGRSHALREHTYRASAPGPETERTMVFFNAARVDGLVRREETPTSMVEHTVDREDFLYYKQVIFGARPKKAAPKGEEDVNHRPILKMIERYHRNGAKNANEDVREKVFWMSEDKIQLTYHTDDQRISSSTREFAKPPNADDKGTPIVMTPDMHTTFQVDANEAKKKNLELYHMLVQLLADEQECIRRVRESEEEVRTILKQRPVEESWAELEISVYDTERNEKAKKHRKEVERQILEEKMRREEMELDYLAPFLAQMGDPEKVTREQALGLKDLCLSDLKQRLIDKANLIQARFEKETADLSKKQQWHHQHQVSMQKDDEQDYLAYCTEAMFKIHIYELRLARHKEMAPYQYMELDKKLRTDRRLAEYINP